MPEISLDDLLNPTEDVHRMAVGKLQTQPLGWITTIRRDGTPATVPVWFIWRDGRVIVMSSPNTVKVRTIRNGSPVGFHLESGTGGDIVIINGRAEVSERSSTAWLPEIGEAFSSKYAERMRNFGMAIETMAADYSAVILITPERISAW